MVLEIFNFLNEIRFNNSKYPDMFEEQELNSVGYFD